MYSYKKTPNFSIKLGVLLYISYFKLRTYFLFFVIIFFKVI
jgi:hypothetical protein